MITPSFLFSDSVAINEHISIRIPTVGEILDAEEAYYSLLFMLTAMPIDCMVQLDDLGIDFTTITDYDVFLLFFHSIASGRTDLIFQGVDLNRFSYFVNPQNGMTALRDREDGAVIDRNIYGLIAGTLRKIHHLKKDRRKPGNEAAKKYMIERARKKQERAKNRASASQLEKRIVALVNTEQFPYTYAQVRELTIYQFNESLRQVSKKIEFDNRMIGIFAGTVSAKDMKQEDLTWM